MSEILVPLTSEYTLQIPDDSRVLIGWVIGFVGILLLSFWLCDRRLRLDRPTLLWSAVLSLLILMVTPFLGILPRTSFVWSQGEMPIQHLMFFAAVPWMVAAGVLGIFPATILAGLAGLLLAYLDTHNIFTPLVFMSVAVIFSWGVRQRFRTNAFKWLRFPVIAVIVSLFFTAPLVFLTLTVSAAGTTAARVAVAMVRFPMVMFALSGMVLMGGLVCVIVQASVQSAWGIKSPLQPAPGEINIKYRLLGYTVPIFIVLLAGVFISSWSVAQNFSRKVMVRQMTNVSGLAAQGLGSFLETGEHLVQELAVDLQDVSGSPERVNALLDHHLRALPYFDELALFDAEGNLVSGRQPSLGLDLISFDEMAGLSDAVFSKDSPLVIMTGAFDHGQEKWAIFVAGLVDPTIPQSHILWGETILEGNLYAQNFLRAIDELEQQGGYWQILGSDGEVIYESDNEFAIQRLIGSDTRTSSFYQNVTAEGLNFVHYSQPIDGTNWRIAAIMPTYTYQELAWQITYPILLITTGALIIIFLTAWMGLSPFVKEMDTMVDAINAVASGNYELEELQKRSRTNKGYFSNAFQKMVINQKHRMDHQDNLLSVSARIAGQLKSKDALHIILGAALSHGASSARMVFFDSITAASPEETDHRIGLGKNAKLLASFDQEVLELSRGQDVMVLQGAETIKLLPGAEKIIDLDTLLIMPLKWKDLGLGTFWVAFTDGFTLDENILEYFKELGEMASLAIVNARTYADSQSSRKLMEDIFNLLPDAILIIDHSGRVLFENSNATKVLDLKAGLLEGQTIAKLFNPEDLAELEMGGGLKPEAKRVDFQNGKAFILITSPVRVNPREVGKVLIFKDLTQQRKQEALKSELVTTVSHELRSPLTLILGYAKILQLTGNLNEQQDTYISNIIDGIEEMKALVQKLLDIGRLEGGDPLDIQPFTAEAFTHRVVESMDAHAKQKNVQINVSLPDMPLLIEADQTFITQALKNLLENAIKFSKMGGNVTLNVRCKDERIIFAVKDQGIGIAPLDQRKLFKKFGRTSAQSSQEQEGSGLGLSIVKTIAERHGGRVWLESQLGKGSSFYFEIPPKPPQ